MPKFDTKELFYSSKYGEFVKAKFNGVVHEVAGFYLCSYIERDNLVLTTFPKTYLVSSDLPASFPKELDKLINKLKPDRVYLKHLWLNQKKYPPKIFSQSNVVSSISFLKDGSLLNFSKKTRNQIKKAQNSKIEISDTVFIEEIYPVYKQTMVRLNSKILPLKYFQDLRKFLKSNLYVFAAKKDGLVIGANVFYINKNYLFLMYNFSDPNFWQYCVNDLLYFETIKVGLQKKVNVFDFGPSVLSDQTHRHFKHGFGAVDYPVFEYVWYKNPIEHFKSLIFRKITANVKR